MRSFSGITLKLLFRLLLFCPVAILKTIGTIEVIRMELLETKSRGKSNSPLPTHKIDQNFWKIQEFKCKECFRGSLKKIENSTKNRLNFIFLQNNLFYRFRLKKFYFYDLSLSSLFFKISKSIKFFTRKRKFFRLIGHFGHNRFKILKFKLIFLWLGDWRKLKKMVIYGWWIWKVLED